MDRTTRRALPWLAAIALGLAPAAARANDEAEKKFDEGIKELDAGHYDAACPLLAESYKLEPLPGALFTLAECEAKWGKIVLALGHYEQYLDAWERMTAPQRQRQGPREKVARAQKEALSRDVPELMLVLPDKAPSDLTVKLDKAPVAAEAFGKAQRLEAGEHVIVVQTRDGKEREKRITLGTGDKKTIQLELPEVEPPPAAPVAVAEEPKAASHLPWTIAAGAVGVVGVTVGIITGVVAMGDKDTVNAHCVGPTGTACDATGKAAGDDGKTMGWVSTIGFVAGAAGLTAAAILFFTEPKAKHTEAAPAARLTPRVFVGPQGAWLGAHLSF